MLKQSRYHFFPLFLQLPGTLNFDWGQRPGDKKHSPEASVEVHRLPLASGEWQLSPGLRPEINWHHLNSTLLKIYNKFGCARL
jgi:hypothetical protein